MLLASLKPASAEQEYRKAISLADTPLMVPEYKLHLVAALSPLGKYAEAADLLTGMIEEDPDNAVYRDALQQARRRAASHG